MEIITTEEAMKQRENFLNQSVEDESGFFELDYSNEDEENYSDEDDNGDDFIESANASNFFVQTDESFQKDVPQNLYENQTTVTKVCNSSDSQSESLLDRFESFFDSFSNDDDYDEQPSIGTSESKKENIITTSIGDDFNHSKENRELQEEKEDLTEPRAMKWPIKSCEVALQNINSSYGNGKSNFSETDLPSNYEKADNKTESQKEENEHEKYLLDINQNETFASLWKMHLEKFSDGFTCNSCIDTFSRKNDLRNHKKRYHPTTDTQMLSEINSNISEDVDNFPSDNSETHHEKETKAPILTPIDSEIQLDTSSIRVTSPNMDTVKNSRDTSVKCDFCEKEYERIGNLRRHKLLHRCEFCNLNFSGSKWRKELSSHKKNQHKVNENLAYKKDEKMRTFTRTLFSLACKKLNPKEFDCLKV